MDTSRVNVRTSDFDTVFFVRQAARSDSGEYELSVQIENMKDTATIRIRVVGARLEPGGGVGWECVWGIEQAQEQCKRPVRNGRGGKSEWGRGRGWRNAATGRQGGWTGRWKVGQGPSWRCARLRHTRPQGPPPALDNVRWSVPKISALMG